MCWLLGMGRFTYYVIRDGEGREDLHKRYGYYGHYLLKLVKIVVSGEGDFSNTADF